MSDRHLKKYKQINIKLDYERDHDVIRALAECSNKHAFICALIRAALVVGGSDNGEENNILAS